MRVRTDYILWNIIPNITHGPFKLSISAWSTKEEKTFFRVLKLCKSIYHTHHFQILFTRRLFFGDKNRNNNKNQLKLFLLTVYNELFANRISWYRIMLFMCIVSSCMERYHNKTYLMLRFRKIVKEKLLYWIANYGWENIKMDEKLERIPYINYQDFMYRRSIRLAAKGKVKYFK